MGFKEWLGQKVLAAGMAGAGNEAHLLGHVAVGRFALHGAAGIERRPIEDRNAFLSCVGMAAERALVRLLLLEEAVLVVGQELLGHGDIDLSLVFLHQLLPADAAR